jgi:Tfp pilus assembly protein PilF
MDHRRFGIVLGLVAGVAAAQTEAAYATLAKAYQALEALDYDSAVEAFSRALNIDPGRAAVHKDLAYTLLKIGQTEAARDHFGQAMRLDPGDDHIALEFAFLCYETREPVKARRTFDRLRQDAASPEDRATAAQAFENIDKPLREGIARWKEALAASPRNFSAHEELARLAEQRDEITLAAEHYEQAWRLRPGRRDLLLDLGRVWRMQDRAEDAEAALLAASRGAEPRVAEDARELLPARYPYASEFERALILDSSNTGLRREFAYFLLQLQNTAAAEEQFGTIVDRDPADLLSMAQLGFLRMNRGDQSGAVLLDRVLSGADRELADRVRTALKLPPSPAPRAGGETAAPRESARLMAERSIEKGYLKDALRYLNLAHEDDPVDFGVMLKLGWTYNNLREDRQAVRWFDLARKSPDPRIAAEATRAYRNLAPAFGWFRTSMWAFPMYSTRWRDGFVYAQMKTEMAPLQWPVRPYVSVRFIGDTRGEINVGLGPQYLSERSAIVALGLATRSTHGVHGWFEAGEAIAYRGTMLPDYRGGVSFSRGFGRLSPESRGWFADTANDGIFVSRFGNDTLLYSQNRTGYTLRPVQFYWNWNVTADQKRQAWANLAESGPGVRLRLGSPIFLTVNALRGTYLLDQSGQRKQSYSDIRVGLWYAVTR